jgi:adenylate kinase
MEIIDERISKKDCQMQGYILDGYPMNISQLQSLQSMKIAADTVFILELEEE